MQAYVKNMPVDRHTQYTDALMFYSFVELAKKADRTAYDVRYSYRTESPTISRLD